MHLISIGAFCKYALEIKNAQEILKDLLTIQSKLFELGISV